MNTAIQTASKARVRTTEFAVIGKIVFFCLQGYEEINLAYCCFKNTACKSASFESSVCLRIMIFVFSE